MRIEEDIKITITNTNYKVISNILKELEDVQALNNDDTKELKILMGKLEKGHKILCKDRVFSLLFESIRKYYNNNKDSKDEKVKMIIKHFSLNNAAPSYWLDLCRGLLADLSYKINSKKEIINYLQSDLLAGQITMYELIVNSFPEKDFDDLFVEV